MDESNLYETLTKGLYKITPVTQGTYEITPEQISAGSFLSVFNQNQGTIQSGKTDFDNTKAGYILGIDNGVAKFYIGNTTSYINWDGSSLSVVGGVSIDSIDIGGADATSFHVDTAGNMWLGAATFAGAPAKISNAGDATFSSITITGGSVATSTLSGTISLSNLNIANQGWSQTSVFSVTDADTVAWGAGTLTTAAGTSYSIGAGNTGNMSAKTYIYLDIAVSTTAYQTTTTASTAVGAGKILVAIAQNATGEATFTVLSGQGTQNIDASSIVANSITANELSTSITYAGSIIIDSAGLIRSGQTDYNTGTGWWIGNAGGTPKFSIGNTTYYLTWDGSTLTVKGTVPDVQVFTSSGTWTKPAGAQFVRVVLVGGGGGGAGGDDDTGAGSGGGGGAIFERVFRASDLTSTVSVTVGAGGTAGTGGTTAGDGGAGGTSSFGSYAFAYGGGGGKFVTAGTSCSGGGGGGTGGVGQIGQSGATSIGGDPASTSGANGISGQGAGSITGNGASAKNAEYGGGGGGGKNGGVGGSSLFGAGGGGGGGGGNGGGTNGGNGGSVGSYTAGGGGTGGTLGNPGTAGAAGTDGTTTKCGTGGGGGGGGTGSGATGGNGGAGGAVGGGGGGGGGSNGGGINGGAGGAGGRGQVVVYTT